MHVTVRNVIFPGREVKRISCGRISRLIVLVLFLAAVAPGAWSEEPGDSLRKHGALSESEFANLGRGRPVSKILQSGNGTEVAPLGVSRVKVPLDFFLGKYRDIVSFKKAPEVLQIGRFGAPPALSDLAGLSLERSEIESLRKCRVGDCALKMSAEMIGFFQKNVDWGARDYEAQANRAYRKTLIEYLQGYLAGGNARLVVYGDKKNPMRLVDEFASIVRDSPYLAEYVPELLDHLNRFPKHALAESEDFFYWSKERFGYKPVVSISHVTIHRITRDGVRAAVIASKQIYASHYFSGSLGLSAFIESPREPAEGAWLIYLNRTRSDMLQGVFGGLIRFFVRRRVPEGLDKYQRLVKLKLESAYQASGQ